MMVPLQGTDQKFGKDLFVTWGGHNLTIANGIGSHKLACKVNRISK